MSNLNVAMLKERLRSRYMEKTKVSRALYERAKKSLPGGLNYSLRSIDPHPIYVERGEGAYVWDVDGNRYLDFWMGHYALIMGHAHPSVVKEAIEQVKDGAHLGFEHEWEIRLAEQIKKMVRSVEMVRFTNSGTEANMYAARVARAFSKRKVLVKFEGCWHGGYDSLHFGVSYPYESPSSAGLPCDLETLTVVLPFNDLEAAERRIRRGDVAAVFLEPIPSGGGFVKADDEFVKGIAEVCEDSGTLLVMDEVITGFRVSPGGAQEVFGIRPHLTTFGKVVGGGFLPAGAVGGLEEVMELFDHERYRSPHERAFHGGTYAGNPLTTRCGYALLRELEDGSIISRLNALGERARKLLKDVAERSSIPISVTGCYSLIGIHFSQKEPRTPREANEHGNKELSEAFHYKLLLDGIITIGPRLVRPGLSASHTHEDVERLVSSLESFVELMKS